MVLHVRVEGEIDRGTVPLLKRALARAEEVKGECLLISLSTSGGYLDAALECRDLLLDAPVKTVAYVNREALSAGALIAISCERIYFAPGGAIGAATPVYFSRGRMEAAPEKVVSAVRETFRAAAEARGRNPDVAAAMVTPILGSLTSWRKGSSSPSPPRAPRRGAIPAGPWRCSPRASPMSQ